jgi:hypothetical protein
MLPGQIVAANQITPQWQTSQQSEQRNYKIILECQQAPYVGVFQNCGLKLYHQGENIENAEIIIAGGMPQHHHGLPTSPKIEWSGDSGQYKIQGLKFSMPGNWVLNFYIDSKGLGKDQASIIFEIK